MSKNVFVIEKMIQTQKWKNKKISQFFIHWYTYFFIYIHIILTKLYGTNIMYNRETRIFVYSLYIYVYDYNIICLYLFIIGILYL